MSPTSEAQQESVDWPRPAAGWLATFEFAAPWLALLLAALAVASALLVSLQAQQAQALRDARLQITLNEIALRLEADLALGYDLPDSARAQRLLEDALAQDATLLAAEVFDPRGVSLFNTDRGSIGEQVPAGWLEAAGRAATRAGNAHPWAVTLAGDRTLGEALRGPFGEVAGHVSVTTAAAPWTAPAGFYAFALAAGLGLLGAGAWLARRALRRALLAANTDALSAAAARLEAARTRLDGVLARLTREEGGAG
jgi:hypothetical protein